MGWTCKTSYGCVCCAEACNAERMFQFPERRNEVRRCKHAFHRRRIIRKNDDGSHQFSQRLLYCFRNMRFSSTRSASIVLTPRVSENLTQPRPRPHAAQHFSSCVPTTEEELLARASPLEDTWHAYRERSPAKRNLLLLPNQQTRKTVVERADDKTDKELYRLCKIANYAEILKIGEFLQTRPARNSPGLLSIPCGELDRPTSVVGGRLLRRIIPGSRIGPIKQINMFNKERSAGNDVKVPSTSDLEPPIQGRIRSIVPCSRDLPEKTQSGLSTKTAQLTRHVGNRDRTGAVPQRKYIGTFQRDSPEMIKGLTTCQILSQTQKERYEVCWKEGTQMTGRQLHQEIHANVQRDQPMYIKALQGHSGDILDISTFSHTEIETGHASLLYHTVSPRHEGSIRSRRFVPGRFWLSKGRQAVYFSLVSPLDPNSDPKYKPYVHMRNQHDRLFVIDLEAAQNSLDFLTKQRTGVFCATTQFRPSSSRRSSTSKKEQKGSEKKNIKRSNCLPSKRVDTTTDSRGKPLGITQNKKQLNPHSWEQSPTQQRSS